MSSKSFQNASKLNGIVSVLQFGAVGDGVTDDTVAIQAAIDSLGAAGGTVTLANDGKYKVLSNLELKPKVFLVGQAQMPGRSTIGSGTVTDYSLMGSCIRLASTATITLRGGSGLKQLMIYRNGMTFPAPNASAFAGTAVTVSGDDTSVVSCMIMGFNKAIYSYGSDRHKIEYVYHDNINGIQIENCLDVAYISNCHAWPFATITTGGSWVDLMRTGKAYEVANTADWVKFTNCFSYGYGTGFNIYNANSCTFVSCSVDGPGVYSGVPIAYPNCTGFAMASNCYETKLVGCQVASQTQAVYIGTDTGQQTLIDSLSIWGCEQKGVWVNTGDVSIIGGLIRGTAAYPLPVGVYVTNTSSSVLVQGVAFKDVTISVNAQNVTPGVYVANCDFYNNQGQAVSLNIKSPTIPSAATLDVPINGDTFLVSGTTSFGALRYGWLGRTVTLIFTGSLTVFNSRGGVNGQGISLNGGVNFSATPNSALTLRNNGNQWFEIGRSI